MNKFSRFIVIPLLAAHLGAYAATLVQPTRDDEVLEILPTITRSRPVAAAPQGRVADPASAAMTARQHIAMARQTGDTRFWGRAQSVLSPWWDRADAPPDLAVLQATVQQGRHEFEAARQVLTTTLARAPGHAQGWLNLAALERLSGQYAGALKACDAVARAGQVLYAKACRLETQSLQGQQSLAAQGFQALMAQTSDPDQSGWLLSLLAESLERAGQDGAAAAAYKRSLKFSADLYTSIAFSDLLLRTGQTAPALDALAKLPDTDAVLLRRAAAWKRLGDARWKPALAELQERTAELVRRGDDPALHGRELALIALWLDNNPARALTLARTNLLLQREPLDWWVAVQSARLAKDSVALAELTNAIGATGLQDQRLSVTLPPASAAMTRGPK